MISEEKFEKIKANNSELIKNKYSLFTDSEMRNIYSISDIYGGDNKVELVKEIKSLLLYERSKMKGKVLTALRNVI